jgi:hypothetical protein
MSSGIAHEMKSNCLFRRDTESHSVITCPSVRPIVRAMPSPRKGPSFGGQTTDSHQAKDRWATTFAICLVVWWDSRDHSVPVELIVVI